MSSILLKKKDRCYLPIHLYFALSKKLIFMKNKLLVLALFCAGNIMAQEFKGGVFAGMTAAQVDGDNLAGFDLPGANLGFFTFIDIGEQSQLQLELSFVQKGSRKEPSDTNPNTFKARINYISVPVLYRYRWNDFSLEIGPVADILVSSNEQWNGLELPSDPPFNRFNLAALVGINYHFSEKVYVNFRSVNSLIPIRPGNAPVRLAGPRFGGFGQRNVVLSFALYWQLGRS